MSEIITVGLVLAKNVFQAHGADGAGRAVLRNKLRRDQSPQRLAHPLELTGMGIASDLARQARC
jgi:hypothetical protein